MEKVNYHDLRAGDYVYTYNSTSGTGTRFRSRVSDIVVCDWRGTDVTAVVLDDRGYYAISVPGPYAGISELDSLDLQWWKIDPDMCCRETDIERGLMERMVALEKARVEFRKAVSDELVSAVRAVLEKHGAGDEHLFRGRRNNCIDLVGKSAYDEEIAKLQKELDVTMPGYVVDDTRKFQSLFKDI